MSHKSVPQEYPTRVSHKSVPQECPTRVSFGHMYISFRTCLHSGSWAPSCLLMSLETPAQCQPSLWIAFSSKLRELLLVEWLLVGGHEPEAKSETLATTTAHSAVQFGSSAGSAIGSTRSNSCALVAHPNVSPFHTSGPRLAHPPRGSSTTNHGLVRVRPRTPEVTAKMNRFASPGGFS